MEAAYLLEYPDRSQRCSESAPIASVLIMDGFPPMVEADRNREQPGFLQIQGLLTSQGTARGEKLDRAIPGGLIRDLDDILVE